MTEIFNTIAHRMNYLVARQGIIAGNIANADTPQYLAKDLSFTPATHSNFAMHVTNARHLGGGNSATRTGTVTEDARFMQHNGNSVRLDMEALKQSQAALDYRTMTQLYSANMQLQQIALGRGR